MVSTCITWQQWKNARKKAEKLSPKQTFRKKNPSHSRFWYTKDFNQWWKRNLKYHVTFVQQQIRRRRRIAASCENVKHLNTSRQQRGKKTQEEAAKRSRFPLCWYQITKQYRLIIIYSLTVMLNECLNEWDLQDYFLFLCCCCCCCFWWEIVKNVLLPSFLISILPKSRPKLRKAGKWSMRFIGSNLVKLEKLSGTKSTKIFNSSPNQFHDESSRVFHAGSQWLNVNDPS